MWQRAVLGGGAAGSHAKTHRRKTHKVRTFVIVISSKEITYMANVISRCPYCPWMGSSSSELNKHKTAMHKTEREREKMKKQLFHAGHTVGQYTVGQSEAIP